MSTIGWLDQKLKKEEEKDKKPQTGEGSGNPATSIDAGGDLGEIAKKYIRKLEDDNKRLRESNYHLEHRVAGLREEVNTLRTLRKKDNETIRALKAKCDVMRGMLKLPVEEV